MFGDMAHGSLLLIIGLFLIYKKRSKDAEALKALFPWRFILTLMGFFSLYAGSLYNDFLSLSFDFFGSCYNPHKTNYYQPGVVPTSESENVYPYR